MKIGSLFRVLISNPEILMQSLTILSVAVLQLQAVHGWNIHNLNKSQRPIHAPN